MQHFFENMFVNIQVDLKDYGVLVVLASAACQISYLTGAISLTLRPSSPDT